MRTVTAGTLAVVIFLAGECVLWETARVCAAAE